MAKESGFKKESGLETCNICCEIYNKSNHNKVCCNYCEFSACRTCCETYVLSENIPKCMNTSCAKEWSRKFMRENFTNVFLTTKFKEHVESVLFDQERALLPATQLLVEEEFRKHKIKNQIKDINKLIQDLVIQKRELEMNMLHDETDSARDTVARFVRACPAETCRGFLNNRWKCGICEQSTCSQCHELKTADDHVCDPNSVETAKLLDKDTKACPKCQTKIFKLSGCDQMWCTQCHTAFSWKTGALEKNIHNPHYYEWQRKNGGLARAAGDIECGNELTHHTVDAIHRLLKRRNCEQYSGRCENIVRNTIHNFRYLIHQYQTDYVAKNQDLRIEYLKNYITEREFMSSIQKNDKKNRKNNEIVQVIQLTNTAISDIVFRMINELRNSLENLDRFMFEFDEFIKYCNEIFKDISFTYKSVQYMFDSQMHITKSEKEKQIVVEI